MSPLTGTTITTTMNTIICHFSTLHTLYHTPPSLPHTITLPPTLGVTPYYHNHHDNHHYTLHHQQIPHPTTSATQPHQYQHTITSPPISTTPYHISIISTKPFHHDQHHRTTTAPHQVPHHQHNGLSIRSPTFNVFGCCFCSIRCLRFRSNSALLLYSI